MGPLSLLSDKCWKLLKMKLRIFALSSPVLVQFCSGTSVIAALRSALLEGYEKDAKPDGKVTVKAGMQVTDLHLCPHKEVLTTIGYATTMWTDNRLTWDSAKFGDMDRIRIDASEVWLPDITLYNLVGPMTPLARGLSVIVFANGLVIWIPPVSSQSHCDVNYDNWPWGEQNCTYTAGSWTFNMGEVDIQPYLGMSEAQPQDSPLDFEHLLHKDKFEITGNEFERVEKTYPCCPNEIYPNMKMSFQFKIKYVFEDGVKATP